MVKVAFLFPPDFDPGVGEETSLDPARLYRRRCARAVADETPGSIFIDVEDQVATLGDLPALLPAGVEELRLFRGGHPRVREAIGALADSLNLPVVEAVASDPGADSWSPEGECPSVAPSGGFGPLDRRAFELERAMESEWRVDVFLEESIYWKHDEMFRNLR